MPEKNSYRTQTRIEYFSNRSLYDTAELKVEPLGRNVRLDTGKHTLQDSEHDDKSETVFADADRHS
jgi:hypothetical protein